jgi:nitroreductase
MLKPAHADYDIHPLLRDRYSPRAFDGQPIDDGELRSLLEAARWAPSCFNEQPWRFIVAKRENEEAFARMLACLGEKNQVWAKNAAVLVITVAQTTFSRNDKPNRHAWHDVGLAVAQLTAQATAQKLGAHQLAGFSSDAARETYGIPDGFEPVTAIAIGRATSADQLPEGLRERELADRKRRSQAEIVFAGRWAEPMT